MRRATYTEPKDGKAVILVDVASGTYDIAHWSAETGEWMRKNGEPSRIKPTHWHPISRDAYRLQEDEASSKPSQDFSNRAAPPRSAGASDVVAPGSVATAVPVTVDPFEVQTARIEQKHAPRARRRFAASFAIATLIVAALLGLYVRQYARQVDTARINTTGGQVVEQETLLPSQGRRKTGLLALQHDAVADEVNAQTGAQGRRILVGSAPEARQSFEKEERLEALANELAEARNALAQARGIIEARNLQINARDTQLREQEGELAMVRRELETNAAMLTKLQRELDGPEGPSREMAMAREPEPGAIDPRATFEPAATSQIAQVTQAVEPVASEQTAAVVSQDGPEVARLIARARALLGQGNISAARTVLERAAEMGSALASFTLAETYDPIILSKWGTYGTRGDAAKARELYAKAHAAGGIQEAKDRFEALDR
ncbi:hypothetical protein [Bradyrhizobium lablabi]|uniref:hypothetical protein n=1 Tax=Bradyrhizobium lablabi TaxID=722472 RepID=UPI001BA4D7CE|nr:hypothetical protein [Bradyrhizobium lablabi]MBR0696602.1 hypothetical protein [Bradyrhizobium lablabi]